MLKTVMGFLVVAGACLGMNSGCTGGCFIGMEDVEVAPLVDCLQIHQGTAPDDHVACSAPTLTVTNDCGEPFTLPERATDPGPTVVPPGGKLLWLMPSEPVAPAISIVDLGGDDDRLYTITATLGTAPITIRLKTYHWD